MVWGGEEDRGAKGVERDKFKGEKVKGIHFSN